MEKIRLMIKFINLLCFTFLVSCSENKNNVKSVLNYNHSNNLFREIVFEEKLIGVSQNKMYHLFHYSINLSNGTVNFETPKKTKFCMIFKKEIQNDLQNYSCVLSNSNTLYISSRIKNVHLKDGVSFYTNKQLNNSQMPRRSISFTTIKVKNKTIVINSTLNDVSNSFLVSMLKNDNDQYDYYIQIQRSFNFNHNVEKIRILKW